MKLEDALDEQDTRKDLESCFLNASTLIKNSQVATPRCPRCIFTLSGHGSRLDRHAAYSECFAAMEFSHLPQKPQHRTLQALHVHSAP